MTEEKKTVETPEVTPPETPETTPTSTETQIPKTRFDEVNERMKAAETKLAENEKLEKERLDKAAEEQGEFKELAEKRKTELDGANATLLQYQERDKAAWKAQFENIPEDKRKYFSTEDTAAAVSANITKYNELTEMGVFDKPVVPGTSQAGPVATEEGAGKPEFFGHESASALQAADPEKFKNEYLPKLRKSGVGGTVTVGGKTYA